jgi:hypothetical protein
MIKALILFILTYVLLLLFPRFEVRTSEFMKISVPFTLAAVTTGYVLIWLIWS